MSLSLSLSPCRRKSSIELSRLNDGTPSLLRVYHRIARATCFVRVRRKGRRTLKNVTCLFSSGPFVNSPEKPERDGISRGSVRWLDETVGLDSNASIVLPVAPQFRRIRICRGCHYPIECRINNRRVDRGFSRFYGEFHKILKLTYKIFIFYYFCTRIFIYEKKGNSLNSVSCDTRQSPRCGSRFVSKQASR